MSTITTLNSTDSGSVSRPVINTNFTNLNTDKAELASPTFTGTVTTPAIILSSETASTIASLDASKNVRSLAVATYPSLTELSYVKGVTSAIQTQLGDKAPLASPTFTGTVTVPVGLTGVLRADTGVISVDTNVTDIVSAASTSAAGLAPQATAPAAGLINVLGIANAETAYTNKALFDTTDPTTQAFGDAADDGTATVAARRDHKHAMMAAPTSVSGNAGTVTVAAETGDTSCSVLFATDVSGSLSPKTNTNLTFNASTGVLTSASAVLTTADINGGTVDGATIGASSATTGKFTSVETTGAIELGSASDCTLARTGAGAISLEGVAVPTISSTSTLTNKRITQRVVTTTDDATAVIDVDTTDVYELTAIANATTISTTGTPTDGQKLMIRLKDAGAAKGLTWDAIFVAIGVTAPTTTVLGKWHYVGCQYNTAATKWHILAVAVQA